MRPWGASPWGAGRVPGLSLVGWEEKWGWDGAAELGPVAHPHHGERDTGSVAATRARPGGEALGLRVWEELPGAVGALI